MTTKSKSVTNQNQDLQHKTNQWEMQLRCTYTNPHAYTYTLISIETPCMQTTFIHIHTHTHTYTSMALKSCASRELQRHLHTHTHTHFYMYLFICLYMCMCMWLQQFACQFTHQYWTLLRRILQLNTVTIRWAQLWLLQLFLYFAKSEKNAKTKAKSNAKMSEHLLACCHRNAVQSCCLLKRTFAYMYV